MISGHFTAPPTATRRAFLTDMGDDVRKFGIIVLIRVVEYPEWRDQLIKTTKPGRNGTVRMTLALSADHPLGAVSVVGNFNDWDPFAHPLRRRANGTRSAAVTVKAGSMLRFRYLADGGVWFDDESAPPWHGENASIAV